MAWLGTTSPFNITAEAATLRPFHRAEVAELLAQHTEHCGQRFEPDAVEHVFELSQGHPWLVNALADQVVNRDVEDRTIAVTKDHIEAAKETIIIERRTHIDSLVARLREPRVRRIIDPMLVSEQLLRCMDGDGQNEAWLVLFDLRKDLTWEERLYHREEQVDDKTIHIIGC